MSANVTYRVRVEIDRIIDLGEPTERREKCSQNGECPPLPSATFETLADAVAYAEVPE